MKRASEPERRVRRHVRRAVPWLVAVLALLAASGAAAETKHVLMLFSNDSLPPVSNAAASSFQRTLQAENPGYAALAARLP